MNVLFDKEKIKGIIPHREPFLLVDNVIEMETGKRIIASYFVSPDMEIFKGHFPDSPVLPGVYTIESMAQTTDILLLSYERYKGMIPYLIAVNNVKLTRKVEPGDTIEIRSKIINENLKYGIVTCEVEVINKEEPAATGEVTLAMR